MAIGDVKINTGRGVRQTPRSVSGQFGEGVSRALQGLSNSVEDQAEFQIALAAKNKKKKDFDAFTRLATYSSEQERDLSEFLRDAPEDGEGITDAYNERIVARNESILQSFSAESQPEMQFRLEQLEQRLLNKVFVAEQVLQDKKARRVSNEQLTLIENEVAEGGMDYRLGIEHMEQVYELSNLPEVEIASLRNDMIIRLKTEVYKQELEKATVGNQTVNEPHGQDIVLAGVAPQFRALLNTVGPPESGNDYYKINNGTPSGAQFAMHNGKPDVRDHPRQKTILKDGTPTTAAGRYQITEETWDWLVKRMGKDPATGRDILFDFSPMNQDKAAIELAKYRYNITVEEGGMKLSEALASGDPVLLQRVKNKLTPTWAAFTPPKNGQAGMTAQQFIESITGPNGIPSGGTGPASFVNVDTSEEFASLPQNTRDAVRSDVSSEYAQRLAAEQKRRKAAHDLANDEAMRGLHSGIYREQDIATLQKAGAITSDKELEAAKKATKTYRDREATVAETITRLDPKSDYTFDGDNDEELNHALGEAGLEFLATKNPEFMQGVFLPLVERTGRIPSDSAKLLMNQIYTGNGKAQREALDTMADIYEHNPNIIQSSKGMSEADKRVISFYRTAREYKTEEEIQEMLKLYRNPEHMKQRNEDIKAAKKEFTENITAGDTTNAFDSMVQFEATLPPSQTQRVVFRQDMQALYAEGRAMGLEEPEALKYAADIMKREWSATHIGAGKSGDARMQRNPPENNYATIFGEHKWIDYQVRKQFGLTSDQRFTLVPDEQTRVEKDTWGSAAGTNPPSYQVGVVSEDGVTVKILEGPDGQPARMWFDKQDKDLVEDQLWVTTYNHLKAKNERLLEEAKKAQTPGAIQFFGLTDTENEASKALLDEAIVTQEQMAVMRASRNDIARRRGVDDDVIGGNLLADMKIQAEALYKRFNATWAAMERAEAEGTSKSATFTKGAQRQLDLYRQLQKDIAKMERNFVEGKL